MSTIMHNLRGNCRVIEYLKVGREFIVLELRVVEATTDSCPVPSSKWLLHSHWEETYIIIQRAAHDHVASKGLWKNTHTVQGKYVQVAFHFQKCSLALPELMMPYECSEATPVDALSDAADAWLRVAPYKDMLVAVVIPSPISQEASLPPLSEVGIVSTPKGLCSGKKPSFFIDSSKKGKSTNINTIIPESDDDLDNSLNKHSEDLEYMWGNVSDVLSEDENDLHSSPEAQPQPGSDKQCPNVNFYKSTGLSDNESEESEQDSNESLFREESQDETNDADNVAKVSPLSAKVHTTSFAQDSDSDSVSEHEMDIYTFDRSKCRKPKLTKKVLFEVEEDTKLTNNNVSNSTSNSPPLHSIFKRNSPQEEPYLNKKRRKLFKGNMEDMAKDIKTLKQIRSKAQKKKPIKTTITQENISRKITEYFNANNTKTENKCLLNSKSAKNINHEANLNQDQPMPHVLKPVNRDSLSVDIKNVKTINKVIVLDDETDDEGVSNELSYDLKLLSSEQLDTVFKRNKYYIHKVIKGINKCQRHSQYKLGGVERDKLQYAIATVPFTNSQLEYMVNLMIKEFCNENDKIQFLDYILKVLLPEFGTRIFMDRYNLNHEEALEKMHQVYVVSNCTNHQ